MVSTDITFIICLCARRITDAVSVVCATPNMSPPYCHAYIRFSISARAGCMARRRHDNSRRGVLFKLMSEQTASMDTMYQMFVDVALSMWASAHITTTILSTTRKAENDRENYLLVSESGHTLVHDESHSLDDLLHNLSWIWKCRYDVSYC